MKYQQGLLLEGTRVLFCLSHQRSINGAVRSWCCLSALQGLQRGCRKKGALSEGPDSAGVSVAPCEQGEPEHRGPGKAAHLGQTLLPVRSGEHQGLHAPSFRSCLSHPSCSWFQEG